MSMEWFKLDRRYRAWQRIEAAMTTMNPRYRDDFEDVLAHPEKYTLRRLESWATWAEGPRVQEPDLPEDELRRLAAKDHRDMEGPG